MTQPGMHWDHDGIKRMVADAAQTAMDQEIAAVERRIRAVRCSVYGEQARVRRTAMHEGFKLQVEGCCEDLVERAEKALAHVTTR